MATKILRSVARLVNPPAACRHPRTTPTKQTRSILFTANGQTRVLEVSNA